MTKKSLSKNVRLHFEVRKVQKKKKKKKKKQTTGYTADN